MRRYQPQAIVTIAILLGALFAKTAFAAVLYESGTLGPTGIEANDLIDGDPPNTTVSDHVYVGVRFQLDQPVITDQVGGHFVSGASGTFFGAIVELDDGNDFPDSEDFTTPDLLGATLLGFPVPSDEVFGDLSLTLDPGWYALVFGSGLFGATTEGAAVRNGSDIANPSYIAAQPFSPSFAWTDISLDFPNHRFVVTGQIIPETSTITLATLASLLYLIDRRSNQRRH